MLHTEKDIINYIQNSNYMMQALSAAKAKKLPNWFIGAGFVRNTIWSVQHGYEPDYAFNDLDLGYYSTTNMSEDEDRVTSKDLMTLFSANWEVVNQAYAHTYNNVPPYISAVDGLAHWIETATCVAATLDDNNNIRILAPWGIDDLLNLKLRLSPCHAGNEYYLDLFYERIKNKKWQEQWPQLEIVTT